MHAFFESGGDHPTVIAEWKGVRHILEVEKDDWITRDDVRKGLDVIEKYRLTYDLLVR